MNAGNDFEKDFFKFFLWKSNGNFTKKNPCEISKYGRRFFKIITFLVKIMLLFMKLNQF